MNVSNVVQVFESIAPLRYAESWDNVGLLIGTGEWAADRILITIDLTELVLREAIDGSAQMIVSYHPPIFEPLKRLSGGSARERIVLQAASAGIAVYSPHTALDAAPGGVNDWLAEALGGGDVRALETYESRSPTEQYKVVTFCPPNEADTLRNALAAVGAGKIGDYELCSFSGAGIGTFMGGASTNPAIGEAGELERVEEVRLEMVCSRRALGLAVVTLREFHSYEEPPIDIYPLQPRPERYIGQGRRVVLDQKTSLEDLAERIKTQLGIGQVRVAAAPNAPKKYQVIGLCAGAGGSLLESAIAQECELFLTGELKHHTVLNALANGCTIVLAGHTNTERPYLKRLRKTLSDRLPSATVTISKVDADPLKVM
jgi:dinuclear metal center YbgI/SA1388 family protein